MRTGVNSVAVCDNLKIAVNVARLSATSGQTVLLSPASASFDEFSGYEERGDKFVEIVKGFKGETQELQSNHPQALIQKNVKESANEQICDDGEVE